MNKKEYLKWGCCIAGLIILVVVMLEIQKPETVDSPSDTSIADSSIEESSTEESATEESATEESATEEEDSISQNEIIYNQVTLQDETAEILSLPLRVETLDMDQIELLAPELQDVYDIEGVINFYEMVDGDVMLGNVELQILDVAIEEVITLGIYYDACSEVYDYPEDAEKSQVEDVEVVGGYEEENSIYFVEFNLGTTAYHIETTGEDAIALQESLYNITCDIIDAGEADLDRIVAAYSMVEGY